MRGTYRKIEDTLFCGKRILHLSMLTPLLFCSNWPGDWILETSVENVWTFARTQITGGRYYGPNVPVHIKKGYLTCVVEWFSWVFITQGRKTVKLCIWKLTLLTQTLWTVVTPRVWVGHKQSRRRFRTVSWILRHQLRPRHPLSPVIKLGIRYPKKKERRDRSGLNRKICLDEYGLQRGHRPSEVLFRQTTTHWRHCNWEYVSAWARANVSGWASSQPDTYTFSRFSARHMLQDGSKLDNNPARRTRAVLLRG